MAGLFDFYHDGKFAAFELIMDEKEKKKKLKKSGIDSDE